MSIIEYLKRNRAAEFGREEHWWERHESLLLWVWDGWAPWEITAPTWLWVCVAGAIVWWLL